MIAGLLRPAAGHVRHDGRDVTQTPAHTRVGDGISLVPEGRRVFGSLTARENLLLGGYRKRPGTWTVEKVTDLFPMLGERIDQRGARLSGGEQQALAIGRALMANSRLLLLDDVSLGLAPIVVRQLYAELPDIAAAGTTVLLVEQDVAQAMAVADRAVCLLTGTVSLEGRPQSLGMDVIRRAYFGL